VFAWAVPPIVEAALADAIALPPSPAAVRFGVVCPPFPPTALDDADALGTLIVIELDEALPPAPETLTAPPMPPTPPRLIEAAEPEPLLSAALVMDVALALPPAPPFPTKELPPAPRSR
jgi:hypothetical protein